MFNIGIIYIINLNSLCALNEQIKTKANDGKSSRSENPLFLNTPAGTNIKVDKHDLGNADLKYHQNGDSPHSELLPSIALK